MKWKLGSCLYLGPHYCGGGDIINKRSVLLAAWHNPRSITWRWSVIWNWWPRWTWKPVKVHRRNDGGAVRVHVPFVGHLDVAWQQSMWREQPRKPPELGGMAACDRCRQDFVYWLPTGIRDDVFHKVQRETGRVVCPACIRETATNAS